jgi:L-threonylcarbamoyladenylate synthase
MRLLTASRDAIVEAAAVLRSGGVVAYPTDTLYGLAVDPRHAAAVRRLFDVKGRDPALAIPLIASSVEQARAAGEFSDAHLRLALAFWPGPLTVVVPARATIDRVLLGGGSTIAVRVPAHPVATALASELGFCITSTSANRSGHAAATNAREASVLSDALDLVLDGGASPGGPPSTIVEVTDSGPRLVRAGAVSWERVLESLE